MITNEIIGTCTENFREKILGESFKEIIISNLIKFYTQNYFLECARNHLKLSLELQSN